LLRSQHGDLPTWMGEEKRLTDSEYAGAPLDDQRLNARPQKIAGTLEANPEVGFPRAMTEAELEAFYPFLSNDQVEPDSILACGRLSSLCFGSDRTWENFVRGSHARGHSHRRWIFHPTFHFPRETSGRHATPRDTMWLMLLNFPNGVGG
jgi:hypothetical protein